MVKAITDKEKIVGYLHDVVDPEIPVLSIMDMGIVRDVLIHDDEIEVVITPTYTGCPAMDMISMQIRMHLASLGFPKNKVTMVLSPAWTTDWMSEEGKKKLKAYGIAPPNPRPQICDDKLFAEAEAVQCPHCDSWHTHRVSEFGSTACKALYKCDDCEEPFDHFKCH